MTKYSYKLYIDASFNPENKKGTGCILFVSKVPLDNKDLAKYEKVFGIGAIKTSSMAEYKAVELGLTRFISIFKKNNISLKKIDIEILLDSQSVVDCLNKRSIPPEDIRERQCVGRIWELMSNFKKIIISWISRKENLAGKIIENYLSSQKVKDNNLISDYNNTLGNLFPESLKQELEKIEIDENKNEL